MFFINCPRCGDHRYEILETHSHCTECNYSPDHDHAYLEWRNLELNHTKKKDNHLAEEARLFWSNSYGDYGYGGFVRSAL